MLVLGSGGHSAELLKIVANLPASLKEPSTHLLIYSTGDAISLAKYEGMLGGEAAAIKQIPRARRVGQSYFTSIFTTIYSFIVALFVFIRYNPKLVQYGN